MNKYNGLLLNISQQYGICHGEHETEISRKTRIVYSICGMMAYASLWDESEESVSIVHLKSKVRKILESYKSMYPELMRTLPPNSEELANEIESQFLNSGVVYHCTDRITPSMLREETFDGICFQRGIAIDSIEKVSGLGFHSNQSGETDIDEIKSMFGLEIENLEDLWSENISEASWNNSRSFETPTEYLRLKPPFTRGYWVTEPDKTGISILRTGMRGSQLYYLYRYHGNSLEISPITRWKVESFGYRSLACASLSSCGTLPPIEYYEDGEIVHVHLNYLLPPHELDFLKLYSWPTYCASLPCDFNRILSAEVFKAIKKILLDEGYEFKGGKFNG